MNNIVNQTPFLRTSRSFPSDSKTLSVELSKSYVDIANTINQRTIGIFTVNRPAVNGESFFIFQNQKQQVLRQVYLFDDTMLSGSTISINHGINIRDVFYFKPVLGEFYDGTNWQNLPYVDVVNATNQINVMISSTQIIITKGAGTPPTIDKGLVILEWIINV